MILVGGRIFVIFLATRHVSILVNIEGYRTYRQLEMSNFYKTRPACPWDADSGW